MLIKYILYLSTYFSIYVKLYIKMFCIRIFTNVSVHCSSDPSFYHELNLLKYCRMCLFLRLPATHDFISEDPLATAACRVPYILLDDSTPNHFSIITLYIFTECARFRHVIHLIISSSSYTNTHKC